METIDASRALVSVPGQEGYVRRRFWHKLRRSLGWIPFGDQALAAWYAATDPATPPHVKGVLFAALAYFVMPADMIPDVVAGLGFTDDATVLLTALQVVSPHVKDDHKRKAAAFLNKAAW